MNNNGGNGTAAADLVIFITEDESGLGYHVDLEEDFGANGKPALEAAIAAKAEGLRGDSASELLHTLTVDQQIYSGDVDYALDSGFKIENILDCAKHDNATPNYDQDGFLLGSQMWDRFSDLQVVAAGGQGTINYIDFAKITETETLQVNPEGDLFYVTCLVSTTLKETSGEKRNRATLKTLSFEQIINSKLEEPSND
jgi:hypothetical protein